MTMTRKQLKAIRRGREIRCKRNVRTNNMHENPMRESALPYQHRNHTYRLYDI